MAHVLTHLGRRLRQASASRISLTRISTLHLHLALNPACHMPEVLALGILPGSTGCHFDNGPFSGTVPNGMPNTPTSR